MNPKSNIQSFWQDLKAGRFAMMVKESAKGRTLSNSREVYHVLKPLFAEVDDVEEMYGIFLDTKNRILAIEKLFSGSILSASVYPREIIKKVIQHRASAFLLAHNHPSGDTEPSLEDFTVTSKIGIAAASIDVAFHDHIIIGDAYYSMADSGRMNQFKEHFKSLVAQTSRNMGGNDEK